MILSRGLTIKIRRKENRYGRMWNQKFFSFLKMSYVIMLNYWCEETRRKTATDSSFYYYCPSPWAVQIQAGRKRDRS